MAVFFTFPGWSSGPGEIGDVRLKNKIIPLTNQVYRLLDHYEAAGFVPFLPQARPYSKVFILNLLNDLKSNSRISGKEKEEIERYFRDFSRESNGVQFAKTTVRNCTALVGFGAETYARQGVGENGATSYSLTALPHLSGDLTDHLTFSATMGPAIEQLTPDLFYRSYKTMPDSLQILFGPSAA